MHQIAPSILSANFAQLGHDIEMINQSEADLFHVDVMDGVFVPNISFGFPVMKTLKELAQKPLDVHLMIVNPDRYFHAFKEAGAEWLSFHIEAETHVHRSIAAIKELGMKAGVALNPHSPISLLAEVITDLDLVVLMSVNPGFGGQKFIDRTYSKISALKELILKSGSNAKIEIDGGVTTHNASQLVKAGADILVAGNAVFSAPSPIDVIAKLKRDN
jgi:ribulose-phosphate 3-epimerase